MLGKATMVEIKKTEVFYIFLSADRFFPDDRFGPADRFRPPIGFAH
jgi:hypothetical protein